jgi:hypothetical protein
MSGRRGRQRQNREYYVAGIGFLFRIVAPKAASFAIFQKIRLRPVRNRINLRPLPAPRAPFDRAMSGAA